MTAKSKSKFPEAQCPLILRCNRLMEAFAKSDDERDFFLDKAEGSLFFADLNKPEEELQILSSAVAENSDRFALVPKLTFYEIKKIMENFINEKVYDIDTKEKLLDIIQAREAREKFLEFIYDNLMELEKWQQFYQERFRIRIIEWLRDLQIHFVFEEDLELNTNTIEKLKENLFETKPPKELASARKSLDSKAKSYYSKEALNPRPKRGRPPKQVTKIETEPTASMDIYLKVPQGLRQFLFTPDISHSHSVTFSAKFESGEELIASLRNQGKSDVDTTIESLNSKLEAIRRLSTSWVDGGEEAINADLEEEDVSEDDDVIDYTISAEEFFVGADEEEDDDIEEEEMPPQAKESVSSKPAKAKAQPEKKKAAKEESPKKAPTKKTAEKKPAAKKPAAKKPAAKKPATKKAPTKKAPAKKAPAAKKKK